MCKIRKRAQFSWLWINQCHNKKAFNEFNRERLLAAQTPEEVGILRKVVATLVGRTDGNIGMD
jgi:hypothetical protein